MCTIRGTPASRAARLAWRGISMPMISRAGDTIRALMPRMTPLLSSTTCIVRSRSMLLGEKMSGVVASPVRQMCSSGENLGVVVRDDVRRKAAVGVAAAAAGVHHGGNAGADAADVRVDAVAVDAFVHVGMQVNQAGRNVFAGDFNDPCRFLGGNVGGHGGNLPVGDANVQSAVKSLRRVNYRAAFDEQVIGSHSRVPSVLSGYGFRMCPA